MPAKNPYLRKLSDIRHRYGVKAAAYFELHPWCENCGEKRIATLSVHHTEGKLIEKFKTLCFNCHMIAHAAFPEYTFGHYLRMMCGKDENGGESGC